MLVLVFAQFTWRTKSARHLQSIAALQNIYAHCLDFVGAVPHRIQVYRLQYRNVRNQKWEFLSIYVDGQAAKPLCLFIPQHQNTFPVPLYRSLFKSRTRVKDKQHKINSILKDGIATPDFTAIIESRYFPHSPFFLLLDVLRLLTRIIQSTSSEPRSFQALPSLLLDREKRNRKVLSLALAFSSYQHVSCLHIKVHSHLQLDPHTTFNGAASCRNPTGVLASNQWRCISNLN